MKSTKNIISGVLVLAVSILLFSSCKKEGPAGPAGANGTNGNANVSSKTFVVSSWSIPAGGQVYADVTDSAITQSIVSSGSVMVYLNTGNYWSVLPYTKYYSDHFITTYFLTKENSVRIVVTESDLTNPPQDVLTIKVVSIASH